MDCHERIMDVDNSASPDLRHMHLLVDNLLPPKVACGRASCDRYPRSRHQAGEVLEHLYGK
jgi:hypothetical protein